jgi:hypothetical protein
MAVLYKRYNAIARPGRCNLIRHRSALRFLHDIHGAGAGLAPNAGLWYSGMSPSISRTKWWRIARAPCSRTSGCQSGTRLFEVRDVEHPAVESDDAGAVCRVEGGDDTASVLDFGG